MSQPKIHRYLRHGTLPQLRVFEASARLGCFARAAEELHIAQPTASVQIRKLTETVGTPLFEQVGKKIYLTEAGRQLQHACEAIFRELVAVEDSLAALRRLEAGQLRLAVSTSGMSFAPRLLGAFLGRYPGVEVSLQAHNRQTLVARLRDNADDLYVFADAPEIEDVVMQELLPNPIVVIARDDHPLAGRKGVAFEELAREPFLLREEGSGMRRIALRLFRDRGLEPRIRLELDSNEAIKEAILAGLGVAILSRYTFGLDPESERFVCLAVEGFPLENHWYLAYPTGKQLSTAARAFLDFARTEAQALVRQAGTRGAGSGAVADPAPAPRARRAQPAALP